MDAGPRSKPRCPFTRRKKACDVRIAAHQGSPGAGTLFGVDWSSEISQHPHHDTDLSDCANQMVSYETLVVGNRSINEKD